MEFNNEFIDRLSKAHEFNDVLMQFISLQKKFAKVDYVGALLSEVIDNLEEKFHLQNNKIDEKCLEFRKFGNELFIREKNYYGALEKFNRSLCHAVSGSANLGVGYMNRSAVLLELKRFHECKVNIGLARETALPEQFLAKLSDREKICTKHRNAQAKNFSEMEYKLTHKKHPKVEYISEFLDLTETDEKWGIQARGKLVCGDLVAIEDAFCAALQPHAAYSYCAYCLKENFFTMIPCPNCTNTLFCDEECMHKAYDKFHKFECPVSDLLYRLFDKFYFGLRIFLISMNLFENFEEFMAFCNDKENQNHNVFTLNYEADMKLENFKAILGLIYKNTNKAPAANLFHFAVMAAIIKKYLLDYTPMKDIIDNEIKMNFFTEMLYDCIQVADYHICDVPKNQPRDPTEKLEHFASAIYPFGSLINQTGDTNSIRVFCGTKCYLFTLSKIPKYTEIVVNYTCPSITAYRGVPLPKETSV